MIIVRTDTTDPGVRVARPGPVTAPLTWTWTSWFGDTWDLTDPASPVLKLRGATGLGPVEPEHWWSESPLIPGSTWDGARIGRGSIFLPLMVTGVDSPDFLTNHGAFIRSLDPLREGVLQVARPDGQTRTVSCRYESGADLAIDLDPVAALRATYGITWATADPFWSGDPVSAVFTYTTGSALFPGPPFHISPGQTLDSATVVNPGDVDSSAVWRVNGPFTGFTVGFGTSVVSMSLTKTAGQWVEIDTRPTYKTITDDTGADQWLATTARKFSPVEPGKATATTSVSGASTGTSVELSFTPRYRSAWA